MKRDCCKFICGAPTTFQGYGIEQNRTVWFPRANYQINQYFCLKIFDFFLLSFWSVIDMWRCLLVTLVFWNITMESMHVYDAAILVDVT